VIDPRRPAVAREFPAESTIVDVPVMDRPSSEMAFPSFGDFIHCDTTSPTIVWSKLGHCRMDVVPPMSV
jgi:hypothetical protein